LEEKKGTTKTTRSVRSVIVIVIRIEIEIEVEVEVEAHGDPVDQPGGWA